MITIREARRRVVEVTRAARPASGEMVAVESAVGRVLAAPIVSDTDLPPFDRVMMDGFAVRASDVATAGVELPVRGEVAAGDAGDVEVAAGEAWAIMTGAPLPPGADAVVPIEWTEVAGGRVRIDRPVRAGQHVAPRAQDLARGAEVAPPGVRVDAMNLSLLIGAGAGTLAVFGRPRVALVTSGDELVAPGAPITRGQIRESNGTALAALLARRGADAVNLGIAADTPAALDAKLDEAADADVVVVTGGSSVGKYDFSAEVVEARGAVRHFDRVAVKPGKPTLFYTIGEQLVFCLPGNPVAAMMTGCVLVAAAVEKLSGLDVEAWTDDLPRLAAPVRRNAKRDLMLPVRRRGGEVAFAGWHGSGDLACLAGTDGFAFVERGEGEAPAGEPAPYFGVDPARIRAS